MKTKRYLVTLNIDHIDVDAHDEDHARRLALILLAATPEPLLKIEEVK